MVAEGKRVPIKQVLRDIIRRDRYDRTRKVGALKVAKDAFVLDTTELTIGQTIDRILAILKPGRRSA